MKRQNTNAQPKYIPPPYVVKCPFVKDQKHFWLETSEWFRAHYRYNKSVKFDTDFTRKPPTYAAFEKICPEKYRNDVWQSGQSVFHAFNIVQAKGLGINTEDYPKGATGGGRSGLYEQKKNTALYFLKCGFHLWFPQIDAGLQQAIRENDIEFFRRDIPETLNGRRKVVCYNPDEPSGETLEHWLVSFWCPGDYWPSWADGIRLR